MYVTTIPSEHRPGTATRCGLMFRVCDGNRPLPAYARVPHIRGSEAARPSLAPSKGDIANEWHEPLQAPQATSRMHAANSVLGLCARPITPSESTTVVGGGYVLAVCVCVQSAVCCSSLAVHTQTDRHTDCTRSLPVCLHLTDKASRKGRCDLRTATPGCISQIIL